MTLSSSSNDEVPAGLTDVDAVIGVGGVSDYTFVFLVEGVHRRQRKRDPPVEHLRVSAGSEVCCQAARSACSSPGPNGVPGGGAEVAVGGAMGAELQCFGDDVVEGEVRDRIVARARGEESRPRCRRANGRPYCTRMRRRRGSAKRSRSGSGWGSRKWPIAAGASGPCCQANPIVVRSFQRIHAGRSRSGASAGLG